ncbi:type VI secretion system baseplate subunit TssF/IglH [Francisella sp. 19X1-34]|uniref:type VI secretion system baseplate subunit TssF/IglH n=1 Tax=Francisella sp. 19X1-34 TaxID=3087177 RepID=UPI002E370944|nr:type VI secretion system baseplate subunit TssF/IglH [Francisella sp. 19X1-34]MED7788110.1 type VI secretion system baseplate subunit TssF/IglH [Francisella sp. 19X1-34]
MDELSITVKEMVNALNQIQSQAERDFKNYTRCLYSSKVKAHFPHMLTPTFQGCYIKVSDCYLHDDSNYIDLEQQVEVDILKKQQLLYSAISTRILPFDVESVENQTQGISLKFTAKSESFTLQDNSFSFWLHSDSMAIEELIDIYGKLNILDKASLKIEFVDSSILEKVVDISYGYDYIQHSNHRFRQNLADPRLQFRINVNLHQHLSQKIRSIKLLVQGFSIEELYQDQLNDLFHTNLIPVVNQYQAISDNFVMDGDYEVYWLKSKERTDFYIHEVLTVYVDKKPLAPIDYKVIYKDNRVGLEFNQISQVYNKVISADIYVSRKFDQGLMNNYHKAKVKWLNQNISTYKLEVKSLITTSETQYDIHLIEPLLRILKIPSIHRWHLQDWKGLLKFTDISALVDIQAWLNDISIDEEMQISLYFKSVSKSYQNWVRFYLGQIEVFLQKNTKYNFRIKGVFQ